MIATHRDADMTGRGTMAREIYLPEELGYEVCTPSGYYQPVDKALVDYGGKRVLYASGIACVDASCCGTGSWQYLRVEGYVVENGRHEERILEDRIEIDTIEDDGEKTAISRLLLEKHPGARIEFRP
jgi:hypothetical protein